ncbi:MAG: autotransporter outer membrane beta-barrel domain-containing protein [Prevotella ruminicola]|uniref:Autotransporter outer membrane beta-barrel domain-containing protein n=1 Tax=Xylanibacter ruminicola TaxID=839 RepID=A0A9D5P0Y0_XYLRU|nr:autotransporter outer membrane beta-barrel domain-containing protein [Xylanibacter ruminicola]
MRRYIYTLMMMALCLSSSAQKSSADSTKTSRLSVGGYGEANFTRNYFSDHVSRYSQPEEHKNDPSHGRFDIPHAVIYLGYDFGKGWSFGTEIEFEHGGAGIAYEKEDEEGGEWEQETEKGGEVELEQFWLQKSFAKWANIRVGHIVVPVGLNNAHHEPLSYFTVYRPEGENTIMPSTWHQTGVSFWGRAGKFRYEAQFLGGLNADQFTNVGWIHKGHKSPMEFDVANKYAAALRIDNYSIPGLRIGLSGYYGHSIGNTYPNDANGTGATYQGKVAIGAIDFTYNAHNWIVRGQADYGYLGNASELKYMYNRLNSKSPYKHSAFVSGNAYAMGIEAGYDIFSQIQSMRQKNERLYVFGRYEAYNPYASDTKGVSYDYTAVKRMAVGLNYHPIKQIVIKAEYSKRFLKSKYNDEPSVNIGIAYEGFFL